MWYTGQQNKGAPVVLATPRSGVIPVWRYDMSSVPQRPAVGANRTCKTCGETKPLGEFPAQNKALGKYRAECRVCYAARYGDKARAQQAAYRASHREEIRPKARQYTAQYRHDGREDAEQTAQRKQEWRTRNLDRIKQLQADRYAANPEKYRAYAQAYRDSHPGWQVAAFHRSRAKALGLPGEWTGAEWEEIKASYGHRCLCCGRCEPEIVLTVDHVIPMSKGGTNHLSNIQPLCLACNQRKKQDTTDYRGGDGTP